MAEAVQDAAGERRLARAERPRQSDDVADAQGPGQRRAERLGRRFVGQDQAALLAVSGRRAHSATRGTA